MNYRSDGEFVEWEIFKVQKRKGKISGKGVVYFFNATLDVVVEHFFAIKATIFDM